MSLPAAVQRQLDEAERLQAQQAPASEHPGIVTDMSQLTAVAPPAPAPAQAPAAPPPEPDRASHWEQKFRTVDGMYRAEVPPLKAANRALESQIVALSEQVRALTAAVETTKKPAEKPAADPRDVEQFGAELVSMVQRHMEHAVNRIDAQVGTVAQSLDERIRALESRVNGVSEQSTTTLEQHFYTTLAAAVPNWEEINSSQSWLQWLAQEDSLVGVPRQVILDKAHEKFDAKRVIAVFKNYLQSMPQRPTLADQASPQEGGGTPPPTPPQQKQLISVRVVEKFYADRAKGRYSAEDAARLEAEFDAAQAEGRIIPV